MIQDIKTTLTIMDTVAILKSDLIAMLDNLKSNIKSD